MTNKQFEAKFKELARNVSKQAVKDANRLVRSGAVDMDDFGDDYRLPKIVLHAAFGNAVAGYRPLNEEDAVLSSDMMRF